MIPSHFISLIKSTANRITNLIKRCALTKPTSDTTPYQIVQCQYLGHVADVESIVPYGLSNCPPINSTGIMVSILSNEENRAAFFNIPQERFKNLKPYEVQIGNYKTRSSVKFDNDKAIVINSEGKITVLSKEDLSITTTGNIDINATGNVNIKATGSSTIESDGNLIIKAPQITLDGTVIIPENLSVSGTITGDGIDLSSHIHSGVQTGTSNTGPPV